MDSRLREIERQAQGGDPGAKAALLRERRRAGEKPSFRDLYMPDGKQIVILDSYNPMEHYLVNRNPCGPAEIRMRCTGPSCPMCRAERIRQRMMHRHHPRGSGRHRRRNKRRWRKRRGR